MAPQVSMEFGTTGRLADAAVAAVKFGVDKTDSIAKIGKLRERLDALEKVRAESASFRINPSLYGYVLPQPQEGP